jgi:hypothetical protein
MISPPYLVTNSRMITLIVFILNAVTPSEINMVKSGEKVMD